MNDPMTSEEIRGVLDRHEKWLNGLSDGALANLTRANLTGANLPHHSICPEVGAFDCFKKVNTGVIRLRVPATARRVSSLIGRKCRAEFAYVMEGSGRSGRGGEYIEGKTCVPDRFDPDPRVECSHGVHFFMTRAEAEAW